MTEQEYLKQVQEQTKCEHVRTLGEACDIHSGGWATCLCAVAAWKMSKNAAPKNT
jgi:hypothetical protein